MYGCSKHIDMRYHFMRNLTKDGVVELVHSGTQDQVTNIMTKLLNLDAFLMLRKLIGVREVSEVN